MCGFTWEIRSWTGRVRWLLNLRYWFADQSCEVVEDVWVDMERCGKLVLSVEDRVQ
jgi:hypothetical protein